MQRATHVLRCLSAVAASVLVVAVTPAAGEPIAIALDDHETEATAPGMTLAALNTAALGSNEIETERTAVPTAISRIVLFAEDATVGIASFYDDPQQTAWGEQYDPDAFTAAAQLEIRGKFGGIQYGRLYQPAYGLGEYGSKKIIVRFNDVGPLRPGRKFDLSRAAMAYFDSTLDKGLLPNFKMTPLPLGRAYPAGPVTDQELTDLGIERDWTAAACTDVLEEPSPAHTASIAPPQPPVRAGARPVQSKPPSALYGRTKAKVAAKTSKLASKVKAAVKARAKSAAKIKVATATAAQKQTDQAQAPVTPWVKRVVNWVASSGAATTPTSHGGTRVASKAR